LLRDNKPYHDASYAGLVPATCQSGQRDAHGRITKRGAAELRAMLCEAVHHASRPTHPLRPYFAQLCARRGYKMAVVAVAHRLARIRFAMWRDGNDFDVGKLAVERGPFARQVVRLYRRKPVARARSGKPSCATASSRPPHQPRSTASRRPRLR
jgi:hypothetical protein